MAMSVVGTPLYLSPELCNGEPYDAKSDMWAAGILLYEVCSKGRLPFAAGNQGAVIKKILMGQYAPLSQNYGGQVHQLVSACLSQDPRSRPTANAMYSLLETFYSAHMKQEGAQPLPHATALADGTGAGASPGEQESLDFSKEQESDHFTLASPDAGLRRAGKQPLWWEWASNDGFVTGKFRTLYGGTPHPSPTHRVAAHRLDRRRASQRHSLNGGLGTILPFSRSVCGVLAPVVPARGMPGAKATCLPTALVSLWHASGQSKRFTHAACRKFQSKAGALHWQAPHRHFGLRHPERRGAGFLAIC